MATWKEKPIDTLSNDELIEAFNTIKQMNTNYEAKRDEYNKRRSDDKLRQKRFSHSLPNQPNQSFIDLQTALNEEMNKRKLVP